MSEYLKGKIYTIRSRSCDLVYIGSTIQTLPDRFCGHKRSFNHFKKSKGNNCASFQILEREDAYIELFEDYPCNSKNELVRYEGQCQRKYECVNVQIAGRTQAEYREENREYYKKYMKKYQEENKEKIDEYIKKYQEENKEKIKEQTKKYYAENKEKIKEQTKKYYEENKEKRKVKITCEVCGASVRKSDFKKHTGTKKHQRAMGSE